ncbi:GAL4-domain-containing protein [Planoprotostelium fungivorum]|uniref:GAL4-domain-containing protein n=1 Tax=Planoprotostelium fungivorum TaxID=1890364 RepID=A0A2P6NNL4_9EUKA|nr:GAL4-domain-containing protein [Planoprotostelium fungivorum]
MEMVVTNKEGTEATKRKRHAYISLACSFCKRRHFKCDGNPQGCSNCCERNITCEYPQREKRGPKCKRVRSPTEADNVSAKEDSSPPEMLLEEQRKQTLFWRDKFQDLLGTLSVQNAGNMFPINIKAMSSPPLSPQQDLLLTSPNVDLKGPHNFEHVTDVNGAFFYLPRSLTVAESQLTDCQRVATYIWIYVKQAETFHPFVRVPPAWMARVDHIIRSPAFCEAAYSTLCNTLLHITEEAFMMKPRSTAEITELCQLKVMMAFGARAKNHVQDSIEFMACANDLIKHVFSCIDVDVGWAHSLMAHYHITGGDINSFIFSINLAYSCGLNLRIMRNPKGREIEVSSLAYNLLYVNHTDRKSAMQRTWNHKPSGKDKFCASLFYLCKTMIEQVTQGKSTADIDFYVDELLNNMHHYTEATDNRSYNQLIASLISINVKSLHEFLNHNRQTAVQLAMEASQMCTRINYLCVGVAWSLAMPVLVFRCMKRRDQEYFCLVNTLNRYRITYPGFRLVLDSVVPEADFLVAAHLMEPGVANIQTPVQQTMQSQPPLMQPQPPLMQQPPPLMQQQPSMQPMHPHMMQDGVSGFVFEEIQHNIPYF